MKQKVIFLIASIAMIMSVASCSSEMEAFVEPDNSSTGLGIKEARAELENILKVVDSRNTRDGQIRNRKISNEFTLSKTIQTRSGDSDSISLYLFNFENENGYALMSGDSRLPSLLVLTEDGNIQPTTDNITNSGVVSFYQGLDNTIRDLTPLPDDPIDPFLGEFDTYGPWENIIHGGSPLCKVKWGQNDPYNRVVKNLNGGKNVVTGCVATAVAQLMSIYQYPPTYDGHIFNWERMTSERYGWDCAEGIQDQIAMLMAQLGLYKHLDMTYRTSKEGGSGAKPENIPRTFLSMGYSSGGSLTAFNSAKIIEELKNGFPVLVTGYCYRSRVNILGIKFSYKYEEGHEWLAHGLLERKREKIHHDSKGNIQYRTTQSVYYPLYNWGWDGSHDGYYLVNTFDPKNGYDYSESTRGKEGEEDNYQFNTQIVIGIRK
ncbi:MAG: C10 family peptidase [Muribaculaceae bacterium]|nr:C10 family peptidase [Muribaculaceae bacterium]